MANNDVRIKLSLDGADDVTRGLNGVGDAAGSSDSKLGGLVKGGLKGAGKALAGFSVAAVGAGVALSVGVVKAYADYEQNLGGIETMFGSTADKMVSNANSAYIRAGLSANEYMSQVTGFSAALLQGLGGDTEKAAEVADRAMVDMSDNANKFGSNISSIQDAYSGFAKQNYTMLDNLKLGYGGTAAEMARLVNDAGLMEDGFVATAKNINEVSYDKIIDSIHAIQDNMGIAGTTAKEATETISGSVGMLKGSFENLLTGLGDADADVATLAGNVIASLETVVNNVGPVIENIGSHMSTLGPSMGSMLESLVGVVSSAIPGLVEAGSGMIGGLIQGVSSALPGLVGAVVPALTGLVQMIASQLPMLVESGMQAVIALGEGLVQAIPVLIPAVVQAVTGMATAFIENLPMFLDVALQLVTALAEGVLAALPTLIAALPTLIDGVVGFFTGAIPQIIEAGISLFISLIDALPQIITTIVAALPQIITSVVTAILGAMPQIVQAGFRLLSSLVQALPAIISAILPAIPSIVASLLRAIAGSIPQLVTAGFNLITGLVKNIGGIIGVVKGVIPQIISSIVSAVGGGLGQMVSAGYNLITGLAKGIGNAVGAVISKAKEVASNVLGAVKGAFGIHSPSKVFRDQIGKQLMDGLGAGITLGKAGVLKNLESVNKAVLEASTDAVKKETKHLQVARRDQNIAIGEYNKKLAKELGVGFPSRVFETGVGHQSLGGVREDTEEKAGFTTKAIQRMATSLTLTAKTALLAPPLYTVTPNSAYSAASNTATAPAGQTVVARVASEDIRAISSEVTAGVVTGLTGRGQQAAIDRRLQSRKVG